VKLSLGNYLAGRNCLVGLYERLDSGAERSLPTALMEPMQSAVRATNLWIQQDREENSPVRETTDHQRRNDPRESCVLSRFFLRKRSVENRESANALGPETLETLDSRT
jgi:hypothetical protein